MGARLGANGVVSRPVGIAFAEDAPDYEPA